MNFSPEDFPPRRRDAVLLIAGAAVVGALTGILGVAFLVCLEKGNALRIFLVRESAAFPAPVGWFLSSLAVAACAAAAAWMVRRFAPAAGGSGVPYVEKILRGSEMPRHAGVLPVKFFGGLLALSSGLVLGREGPMVQMGAVVGEKFGRLFSKIPGAWKALMTAGAGAGLAAAFNAPVGGTLFILEEVQRKITPLAFLLAATAATAACFVQRAVFQMPQDYHLATFVAPTATSIGVFLVFGLFIGLAGIAYNAFLMAILRRAASLSRVPVELRAGVIGFLIGGIGWMAPEWVGGGDDITQRILGGGAEIFLGMALLRFVLGPLSYAAGTPGGLFAPIIALGALTGAGFGLVQEALFPGMAPPLAFAVAGMAAFFTATVRAPITGIVICLEMTGAYALFFPMLATCLGASLLPAIFSCSPIYDSLADLGKSPESSKSGHATLHG